MGLLDSFFGNADQTQALGLLGAGLMAGNAPQGFMAAQGLLADAPRRRLAEQMAQMQMAEMQDKIAQRQKQRQFLENLPDPTFAAGQQALAGGGGPTMANAANVRPVSPQQQMLYQATKAGVVGLPDYLKTLGPVEAPINKLDAKDFTPASLAKFAQSRNYADLERLDKLHFADTGDGISGINPFTGKPVNTVPKTGDPFKDLVLGDGQGGMRPNSPLIGAKQSIAKSGASRTDVRVENKMGESLAGQVGPMVKDSRIQTDGAVKMFDAADRIEKALNSDKVLAGPGASKIQTVRQFAQMVGGGNDEGIRQTRQVVKSLAQMAVEARKQLQGQGQVTESEAKAVMKADAGEIDDMTVGELRDLVTLTKRAAHFTAKGHSEILNQLGSNSGTASLVPFYKVPRMEELLKHEPKLPQIGAQPSVDDLLKKYGGK